MSQCSKKSRLTKKNVFDPTGAKEKIIRASSKEQLPHKNGKAIPIQRAKRDKAKRENSPEKPQAKTKALQGQTQRKKIAWQFFVWIGPQVQTLINRFTVLSKKEDAKGIMPMKTLLLLAIAVCGYFMILSSIMASSRTPAKRMHGRYQQSAGKRSNVLIAAVTLAIYGLAVAAILIMSSYTDSLGLVLYMVLGVASFTFTLWQANALLSRKNSLKPNILAALLVYAFAVLCVALFMRRDGINFEIQMDPLAWLDKTGASFQKAVRHMLLNIFMLVPFGMLTCLLENDRKSQPLSAAMLSALLSVCIETGQLMCHAGTCDIDDILANTLGGALGAVCVLLYFRLCGNRGRSAP